MSDTTEASQLGKAPGKENMVSIAGGTFMMGSDKFYPEEKPKHKVTVDGFWMDKYQVTNKVFSEFVSATNYKTLAERPLNPADFPTIPEENLAPGSMVFEKRDGPVDLKNYTNWWKWMKGACWKHPHGPESTIIGLEDHPVVHIAFEDAEAYAKWAGKELPTEAEWEFAARGGLEAAEIVWGDELMPGGKPMANTWQGEFPWQNLKEDGYEGTAPVGSFPANGYGLYDMAGNVWEWTSDSFATDSEGAASAPCCAPPTLPGERFPRKVIKGGSHLCAPNYCLRYRPAARQGETVDTSTAHIGFRCIVREAP